MITTLYSVSGSSYDKIIISIEACIFREYHILAAVNVRDGCHTNAHSVPQPHKVHLDREERVNIAATDREFQRARSVLGVDERDGPIKTVTGRVQLPFAGVRCHRRISTGADKYYKVRAKVVKVEITTYGSGMEITRS